MDRRPFPGQISKDKSYQRDLNQYRRPAYQEEEKKGANKDPIVEDTRIMLGAIIFGCIKAGLRQPYLHKHDFATIDRTFNGAFTAMKPHIATIKEKLGNKASQFLYKAWYLNIKQIEQDGNWSVYHKADPRVTVSANVLNIKKGIELDNFIEEIIRFIESEQELVAQRERIYANPLVASLFAMKPVELDDVDDDKYLTARDKEIPDTNANDLAKQILNGAEADKPDELETSPSGRKQSAEFREEQSESANPNGKTE